MVFLLGKGNQGNEKTVQFSMYIFNGRHENKSTFGGICPEGEQNTPVHSQ
jgi:hypothetical protein